MEDKEYIQRAKTLLDTYTVRNLPLHHNEYFILHRYYEEIEKDATKLVSILALAFARNMTAISNHSDYFALLELMNLSKAMVDVGHCHSAKRLYYWAREWVEEFNNSKEYANLKYSITELEKYIKEK